MARTPNIFNPHGHPGVIVMDPFTRVMLQRAAWYRNKHQCPRCGAYLDKHNPIIDMKNRGLACGRCI